MKTLAQRTKADHLDSLGMPDPPASWLWYKMTVGRSTRYRMVDGSALLYTTGLHTSDVLSLSEIDLLMRDPDSDYRDDFIAVIEA